MTLPLLHNFWFFLELILTLFFHLFSFLCIYHKICLKIFPYLPESLLRIPRHSRYSITFIFLKRSLLEPSDLLQSKCLSLTLIADLATWPLLSHLPGIVFDLSFVGSFICHVPCLFRFCLICSLFLETIFQKLLEKGRGKLFWNFACLTLPLFYADTWLIGWLGIEFLWNYEDIMTLLPSFHCCSWEVWSLLSPYPL